MRYTSLLSVTAQADDLALLTPDELRAAAGVKDETQDNDLKRLGGRVADRLMRVCQIRSSGVTPPTILKESLVETFRRVHHSHHTLDRESASKLTLARRPIRAVTSVIADGTTLVQDSDFEILAGEGQLRRLSGDIPIAWSGSKIIVTYDAGYDAAPESLKKAAEELVRLYLYQDSRDPSLRQISIPGVIERQFWVGSSSDPDIPQNILDMVAPFTEPVF